MLKVIKEVNSDGRIVYVGFDNNVLDFHVKQDKDYNWIVRKDSDLLSDFETNEKTRLELLQNMEELSKGE